MHFSRRPTPFEWALAFHLIAVAMIGFGVVGLVAAHRGGPEKEAIALALQQRAFWTLALGLGLVCIFWLVRKLSR